MRVSLIAKMTSQKEDLYRFLYLQYLEEPQRVKPIPIFEFRNKMICELVFSAANQFDLNTGKVLLITILLQC